MSAIKKQLSNPFSTGGGGVHFETRVQAAFVTLMLCGGVAPAMPPWPISKIKLQGKHAGFETDDFIAFVTAPGGGQEYKLLAQIKHSLLITEKDATFRDVIAGAWLDFNNSKVFQRQRDQLALITGPLSAVDIEATRWVLEHARHSESSKDFFEKMALGNFVSEAQRRKLRAFQEQLKNANGADVPADECWQFLKSFHLLGYDLDIQAGVTLSLLHSIVGQFAGEQADRLDHGAILSSAATIVHDPTSCDCIPSVVCRRCLGAVRQLSQHRRRQFRCRARGQGLGL